MTFIQKKQKEAQDIFIANMIAFEEMTSEHKTEKRATFILKQLDTLIATTIQDTLKELDAKIVEKYGDVDGIRDLIRQALKQTQE